MSNSSDNTSDSRLLTSIEVVKKSAEFAQNYIRRIGKRSVAPNPAALDDLRHFDMPLPENGNDPIETIKLLDRYGSPATTVSTGGRFFGLVVGATLPAALGARQITSAWDQVVFNDATSPVGVKLEQVASNWILDILNLSPQSSVGFVTGATMGNFTCLAGARHATLKKLGWNVEKQGLWDAPKIRIIASEQIHVTVLKALSMLGIGTSSVEYVKCDNNGTIITAELPKLDNRCIILTQAGNVNSGASDPIGDIADIAREADAWVHVDGAFGLWAAASKKTRHQLNGYEKADSWVTDGHKWLNTPYDCGLAICKSPVDVHNSMATTAPYLKAKGQAAPKDMVPEFSRAARAVEIWAALHSLGKDGAADLVDRCCARARQLASGLEDLGFEVMNDVVLNQVVATLPGHENKSSLIAQAVQDSGEAWFGPTKWNGKNAIRLSISSWLTTNSDIERTLSAIEQATNQYRNV